MECNFLQHSFTVPFIGHKWVLGAVSPGVKHKGLEADRSSPSTAEVKNDGAVLLCGPYTINHVAQNCFAQHKFAHSRSSQSAPYTVNRVAQHAMLRNVIDRVWAPLLLHTSS
jgi:hypothetical protein